MKVRLGDSAAKWLLFFPVLLHILAFVITVAWIDFFEFKMLDFFVLLGVCCYFLLATFMIPKKESRGKFILLVYSILITLILAELLFFVLENRDYLPWTPMHKTSMATGTMPGIEGKISFTINQYGVRGPEIWPSSRNDRILCLGGSTTECLYVTNEKSWPWLLGTRLTSELERDILVANIGRSGHFTLHHTYQLKHYKHIDKFGVVIIMCGINDVGTLLRDNYEKRVALVPRDSFMNAAYGGAYYHYSYFVRVLKNMSRVDRVLVQIKQDSAGEWHRKVRQKRQEQLVKNTITSIPAKLQIGLDIYRSNLVEIIEQCSKQKQRLIFLTQATLYHKNMPNALKALLTQYTETGAYTPEILEQVNLAYNKTLLDVSQEHSILCVDLASLLKKDTSVLYDDCHFNESGCEKLVNILLEQLVKRIK